MRYFVEISYIGTGFHGWQLQINANTIQEELEKALSIILKEQINLHGSSRTDTGVHARQQFVHFDCNQTLPKGLIPRINRFLPSDIAVINIVEVDKDAHTRFDAIGRKYIYRVISQKDPFKQRFTALYTRNLDINLMNKAAALLLEHEDFKSFSKVKTDVFTFNCIIQEAVWKWNENVLEFHITANRFLRGMVRAIVGTLMDVGDGRKSIAEFEKIIQSKDRTKAGFAAKAIGLTLEKVIYPDSYFES